MREAAEGRVGECAGGRLWECALRACAERVTQPAEELVELLRRPGRVLEHVGAGGRVPARVAASLAGRVGLVAEGLVLDVPQQPLDAEELRLEQHSLAEVGIGLRQQRHVVAEAREQHFEGVRVAVEVYLSRFAGRSPLVGEERGKVCARARQRGDS